jgi:hypothetical protein
MDIPGNSWPQVRLPLYKSLLRGVLGEKKANSREWQEAGKQEGWMMISIELIIGYYGGEYRS